MENVTTIHKNVVQTILKMMKHLCGNYITNDVNDSMAKIISTLELITRKHAPIERASRSKQKLLRNPLISKGTFQSIKEKQRLFKTHFFLATPLKLNTIKFSIINLLKLRT